MNVRMQYMVSMLIYGSIGLFVMGVSLPSVALVQWRCIIGSAFMLLMMLVSRRPLDVARVKANALPLFLSGCCLGSQWVVLFESYRRTSVGLTIIICYFAPVLIFFISPILFKTKINLLESLGILAAMFGMILVNLPSILAGVTLGEILFPCIATCLYAGVVLCNQYVKGLTGRDSTLIQLGIGGIVTTVYAFVSTGTVLVFPSDQDLLLVLILGLFHTGFAYILYFYSIQAISVKSAAVLSYIEPASALVFSAIFLREHLGVLQILGACLIFGGTIFAQLKQRKVPSPTT